MITDKGKNDPDTWTQEDKDQSIIPTIEKMGFDSFKQQVIDVMASMNKHPHTDRTGMCKRRGQAILDYLEEYKND